MSHEIRTPLHAVIGPTEVVLGAELSEFQRDHLRTVLDSGDALLHLINEVLDFSKIEARAPRPRARARVGGTGRGCPFQRRLVPMPL